ncbi:hypothetical protein [Streptomyces vinaceus]|uniref:hypothetical protein n=1 Tax=Streptomyces vinaceus TaxID=1960 RepID=UPI0038130B9D
MGHDTRTARPQAVYKVLTTDYVGSTGPGAAARPRGGPGGPGPRGAPASRVRVPAAAALIVPGHGSPFRPDDNTPR